MCKSEAKHSIARRSIIVFYIHESGHERSHLIKASELPLRRRLNRRQLFLSCSSESRGLNTSTAGGQLVVGISRLSHDFWFEHKLYKCWTSTCLAFLKVASSISV